MKSSLCLISLAVAGLLGSDTLWASTNILTQWNFNFPVSATGALSDDSVLTGTTLPCIGSGTLTLIGGVALGGTGYDNGSPNCPPCDPFYQFTANNPKTGPNTNNSAIMMTNYPAVNAANLSGGFEISFSTAGYTNISVSWEQREGQRASRYHRLRYSTDGVTFTDVPAAQGGVIAITTQNIFYPQTNNLSAVTAAIENNPNVKLRLVAEFESTAITGGTQGANYVGALAGTSAQYLSTAEVRVDMLTIWGDASGAATNAFPTITVAETNLNTIGSAPVTNTFTIGDTETPVDSLTMTAASGNTNLVPPANIVFLDTTGATRRVMITPTPTCQTPSGTANVALTVTDGDGQFVSAAFQVTVASGSPRVQNAMDVTSLVNTPASSSFTLSDADTPVAGLSINFTNSSITNVVAPSGIAISGTDSNRTVNLTPQPGALGGTIISVSATDGTCSDTNSFLYMVVPRSDVILYDSFNNYPDGPLTTGASGGVWLNNVDTPGAVQVVSQAVRLNTAAAEEYVRCPLSGRGTYLETNSLSLYSALKLTLLQLPSAPSPGANTQVGNFNGKGSPGGQRARFFASNQGADPGFYRLGISSTANTPNAYLATNLSPNVTYTVVTYYNPTNGVARLWLNPTSESDTFAEATDAATADIEYYALRQRATASDAVIDDLVVATSFAGALLLTQPTLKVAQSGSDVILSWATNGAAGYSLYATTNLVPANWQLVTEAPYVQNTDTAVTITNAAGSRFYRLQQ